MVFAVTDLETTGGSTKSTKITEIAIYLTDGEKIIDEYSSLINPEQNIPPFITRLTGINDEMVEGAPRFFEVAKDIIQFIGDAVFVAHNVGFDYNVLRSEYLNLGYDFRKEHLCTVRSTRYMIPGHASYSLGKISNDLNIQLENRHRAAGDALATVKLFQILYQKSSEELIKFIQKDIQPKHLHPGLDLQTIDELPKKTGVYKFYNEDNSLIYIGKSKNINSRVKQHLKNNSSKKGVTMREELTRVEFELTGSETIALLKESSLIKKHKPRHNRALRKDKYPFGLYTFEDGSGYINLLVDRVKNKNTPPLTTFSSKIESTRFLEYCQGKYELCRKLIGLYPTKSACFNYHIKECKGACVGEEPVADYNLRVNTIFEKLNYEMDSFFIVDSGRTRKEISLVLVENGSYRGFGYISQLMSNDSVENWKEAIEYYPEDKDSRLIIQRMIRLNDKIKLRKF
jgi:DNA polymerase-3 subunit epsilon